MGEMQFPRKIRGLGWITAVFGLLCAIWLPLEGQLTLTIVVSVYATAVWFAVIGQRILGGRTVEGSRLGILSAVIGFLFGTLSNLMVFLFMTIKTGVHAHGPEFTTFEIDWVWAQLPYWAVAGGLAGLGLSLLLGMGNDAD